MHPIWTLLRCVVVASLVFFLAAWATSSFAQPRAFALGSHKLTLDGRLDEPAWQSAPLHERFVQYLPSDKQPPPAGCRTTVQVLA
jgi:hypothetical protein